MFSTHGRAEQRQNLKYLQLDLGLYLFPDVF